MELDVMATGHRTTAPRRRGSVELSDEGVAIGFLVALYRKV
jgi:hypothetical protein